MSHTQPYFSLRRLGFDRHQIEFCRRVKHASPVRMSWHWELQQIPAVLAIAHLLSPMLLLKCLAGAVLLLSCSAGATSLFFCPFFSCPVSSEGWKGGDNTHELYTSSLQTSLFPLKPYSTKRTAQHTFKEGEEITNKHGSWGNRALNVHTGANPHP